MHPPTAVYSGVDTSMAPNLPNSVLDIPAFRFSCGCACKETPDGQPSFFYLGRMYALRVNHPPFGTRLLEG